MKKSTLFLLLFCLSEIVWSQKVKIDISTAQRKQINRGYGMFIHFGVNTFNEIEWSNGTLPATSYNPTNLDCDQWIQTAKEAGFRYVILVTKHHDGFCLWDSKYTDYDVASSPVKTDVVAEVAKACKKYGLQLGLYYSLWDRHEPSYKNHTAYDAYMKNQLTELMTNYGSICELWFDGAWDKKVDNWPLADIYRYVKEMQPNCMITVNHTIVKPTNKNATQLPENYAEGDPIRYFPVDFRIKDPNLVRWNDPKYYDWKDTLRYLPFEHTICISDRWNWFQKKKITPPRPLDELEELFYWGTANDNILIVNVPPDVTGQINTNEKIRIIQLAERLGIRGGAKKLPTASKNLSFQQKVVASSALPNYPANNAIDFSLESYWTATDTTAELEIQFDTTIAFNRISLFEKADMIDLGDKFSILRKFKVAAYELQYFHNEKWDTFYVGDVIGACKIIHLPITIRAEKMKLKIVKSTGNPSIYHIGVSEQKRKK